MRKHSHPPTWLKFLGLAACLAVAAWAYGSHQRPALDGFPLSRFDRVDKNVYRGAQPSPEAMQAMVERYHIRSVLKLNHTPQDIVPAGVTVIEEPLGMRVVQPPEVIERILNAIEKAPKPIFIHCTRGEDRTGLVVGLYRLRHGVKNDDAHREMISHGFYPYPSLWQVWQRVNDCILKGNHPSSCN